MKTAFTDGKIADFWSKASKDYTDLGKKALKYLLSFATTHRCEQAFSAMCVMKNKYRNRLDIRSDFRVKVSESSIQPNISDIMDTKERFNSSH